MKRFVYFPLMSLALLFVMFAGLSSFTSSAEKSGRIAVIGQDLKKTKPAERVCFEATVGDVYFYLILDINNEDDTFTGGLAGADGKDSESVGLSGSIDRENQLIYMSTDKGDESVWTATETGIMAEDGTEFTLVDC